MKVLALAPKPAPLFAPRLTAFAAINWPAVMESHEFQFIGLCNDPERRSCYGKPYIEDAQAAPFQGLPFVVSFKTEEERALNQLLHELRLIEQHPERAEKLLTERQREFLATWVPVDLPAAFYGTWATMRPIERWQVFLREMVEGARQTIYHQRLNVAERVQQKYTHERRQQEREQHWATVDKNRELARQVRHKLQRESGYSLTFSQPAEQLDLFATPAAA